MTISRVSKAAWIALFVMLPGCGDKVAPPKAEALEPVSGTVKIGGQPAAGVRVLFTPSGAGSASGAWGVTDSGGNYKLEHNLLHEPGIAAGQYTVQLSKFLMSDGSPVPAGKSPFALDGRESIPAAYSNPVQAGPHNTVTVPKGGKTFDFDIPK
jgi:hypothetical protein